MSSRNIGLVMFMREFFSRPAAMGAALPTSTNSSRKIAAQVPLQSSGLVIELGAGTGVVSRELLNVGVMPDNLVLVEQSSAFCEMLLQRFHGVRVINGDAGELDKLLGPIAAKNVVTVVSALPLRSLPPEVSMAVGRQIEQLLPPNGVFMQLTYSWSKTHVSIPKSLKYSYSKYLLCNFPPARIDIFKREA